VQSCACLIGEPRGAASCQIEAPILLYLGKGCKSRNSVGTDLRFHKTCVESITSHVEFIFLLILMARFGYYGNFRGKEKFYHSDVISATGI